MKRGAVVLAAGCALVLTLTACGSSSGGDAGVKGAVKAAGGPPPGGWPQPENGRLTPRMCGLLTEADYARYGHKRLPVVSQKTVDGRPNAVDCLYMTQDDLTLGLQPTAQAARLVYAAALTDHRSRLTEDRRPTVLATNVVPGADESWFDYWTLGTAESRFKEYEVQARRGAFLVGITLSGLKGKTEQDPRTLLAGLAGLVLERVPDVGRTDTGTTDLARFSVVGAGRAKRITYTDPATRKTITLKNVKLPWHADKPLVALGAPFILLNLNAIAGRLMSPIGCDISVNGKTAVEQAPQATGFANCVKSYTPPE